MFLGSFFYFILNIDILSKAARDRKASVDAKKKAVVTQTTNFIVKSHILM